MTENSQPAANPDAAPPVPTARLWPLAGTIALVAWSCFRFPYATFTQILDSSWAAVLVYARERSMQFGRDIVYTYGPLGFLSIRYFSPYAAVARIFFEIAIGFGIAAGLCLLAWRLTLPWRLAMLAFFIFLATPFHIDGDALFLDTGLFAWGLLCFLENGARLRLCLVMLVILAATGALIKFTFLVTGSFTIALLAFDLVLRRHRILAAAALIGFALTFLLGWTLLGQRLSALGVYLSTSYQVSNGYNAVMGKSSVSIAWVLIMTIGTFVAIVFRVIARALDGVNWPVRRRGALFAWMLGLLFITWKYGCVRTDPNHVVLMLGILPIMAIAVEALPAPGKRFLFCSRAGTVLCLVAGYLFMHSQLHGFALFTCVRQTVQNMSESLVVVTRPSHYLREKTGALREEQAHEHLPRIRHAVGSATADIFGINQEFAFPNELNYRPRPVFQSYAAYNRAMLDLNEQFYLSGDAPDFVLFNLQTIDGWLPPLADASVIRHLLANYAFLGAEADYLLLRKKTTAKVQLTLVKEGAIRPGEKFDFRNIADGPLWLEIDLQPTIYGRMRQFLYKPPATQLLIWDSSAGAPPVKFQAPAAMLSAGFLARPLVLGTQDVLDLYTDAKVRPVAAFSVEVSPALLNAWQPQIHYRLYHIENHIPIQPQPH